MRFVRVLFLVVAFVGTSLTVSAPSASGAPPDIADGAGGCFPGSSGTMTIAKGSVVSCSQSKAPGLSVKWTSSGFSPASSTRLNQDFKATTLGSAWIKAVITYNNTITQTFRYKIVIKEGPPLGWDAISAHWVGSNPNDHKVRFTAKKVSGASSYRWDLGDGRVKWGREITHTYSSARKVSVKLTVKFNDGAKSTKSKSFYSNAAVAFAPQLVFAPTEKRMPDSASAFVDRSTLKWRRPECTDKYIARSPSPSRLKSGYWSSPAYLVCASMGGTKYGTDDLTRPFSSIAIDRLQGFYLDAPDTASSRNGSLGRAKVYYRKRDSGTKIRYWFFYAYNDYQPYAVGSQKHEGDWETIEISLNDQMRLRNVAYASHGCDQKPSLSAVTLINSTHPVVYVAKGSHASYWKSGNQSGPCQIGKDKVAKSDRKWNTWQGGDLRDITKQPWYGYGGGWGSVGKLAEWTGPVGPPWASTK